MPALPSALTAVTGREYADIDTPVVDGTGVTRQERLIEPATSYNVLRLQRDLGSSNIGALVTGDVVESEALQVALHHRR